MARLIDADALCNRIREIYDGYMLDEGGCRPLDFEDMVEEQPTAYDVDAVVKELEQYKNFITIQARGFVQTAINIVKEGVKDGKND